LARLLAFRSRVRAASTLLRAMTVGSSTRAFVVALRKCARELWFEQLRGGRSRPHYARIQTLDYRFFVNDDPNPSLVR
jgi:hypothetical protein